MVEGEVWVKWKEWKDIVLMKFEWVRGYGIFIEAIVLYKINYYLTHNNDVINYIKNILKNVITSTVSATDIIAIFTSLFLSIGFIYYAGFITARRKNNPTLSFGENFRDIIIAFGAIFFSAIFLPLLSDKPDINWYILINILFVFGCGYVNERITQQYEAMGLNRTQR